MHRDVDIVFTAGGSNVINLTSAYSTLTIGFSGLCSLSFSEIPVNSIITSLSL